MSTKFNFNSNYKALKSLKKDEISFLAKGKASIRLKKGEVLFNEGDEINGVYYIKKGVCKVSKTNNKGREQIVCLVKEGTLLGERNLLNNECANLKSTAINNMEVCFIKRDEILNELNSNPKLTLTILKNIAIALKSTDNNLVNLGQQTVKQRLAHTLVSLNEKFGNRADGVIDIDLSREDFANIVGTTKETIIRILSEFNKKGFINIRNKNIEIIDIDMLNL